MAVSVRAATFDDMAEILAMGRALHAESPRYSVRSYDEEKVFNLAQAVISTGGAFIAEKDGTIIGLMAGFVVEDWFGHDKIGSDFAFYVKFEERRKGRAAVMLVRAWEKWAIDNGAVDLTPGVSTQIDPEATARFFEKLGYARTGFSLHKRVG